MHATWYNTLEESSIDLKPDCCSLVSRSSGFLRRGHLHDGHPGSFDMVHLLHAACQAQLLAQARQVEVDLLPLSLKKSCTGTPLPLLAASEPSAPSFTEGDEAAKLKCPRHHAL